METYGEEPEGGYYIAGTRISLDSVVHAFQQGESPEEILRSFPKNEPASWRPGVSKAILKVRFLADAKLPRATIPVRMKDPAEAKEWVNRMEWPPL